MFQIDPNTVYTVKDISELSGYAVSTVSKWFQKIQTRKGPGGQIVTGKVLLEYFEGELKIKEEKKDLKLESKLKKIEL